MLVGPTNSFPGFLKRRYHKQWGSVVSGATALISNLILRLLRN
jgi:hypothetical protein